MALHEPTRSRIYHHFASTMGTEDASALMDQFPSYDLTDVVTTEVLDLRLRETEGRLRTEIGALRTEMHTEFGKVRGEMGGLRTEMHTEFGKVRVEMGGLRTEMHTEFGRIRADAAATTGRFEARFVAIEERMAALPGLVIKELLLWLVPVMLTAVGLSTALAKLVG